MDSSLQETMVNENVYFRGYNSDFDIFGNKDSHSFTWITDDLQYAAEYARVSSGRIAVVKLMPGNIADAYFLDEDFDYIAPAEEDMMSLYASGFIGYSFYANHNDSYCLCVKSNALKVCGIINKTEFINILKY